jgi:hypothetical protein
MEEVVDKGFRESVIQRDVDLGLPRNLNSICELVDLCTKVGIT